MSKVKTLVDSSSNIIYPATHATAVFVEDEGGVVTTLDEKLENVEGHINTGVGLVQNGATVSANLKYTAESSQSSQTASSTANRQYPVTPDADGYLSVNVPWEYTDISGKVDKETGKGLSTNDYTTSEKTKLAGIAEGAEVNVQSDWNQNTSSADDYIKNKPTLATVATSGSYNDLSNKPTIPAEQIQADWNQATTTAKDYIKNKPTLGTASAKDVPASGNASSAQVVMGSDTRLTDSRPASDVSSWAKASTKPSYTASEVGAIATTAKGANGGVAELDSSGKVPSSQLPSFVDDVLEYSSKSAFPATGEAGKIYVATDTNKTYRWSGTAYVEISESIALGETSSTAYRGDRGKTAYDHSQTTSGNPHNVTKTDVGLGNVGNFKAVSTAASQGLTDTEKANARTNIGAGTSSFSGSYNDLTNKPTIPSAQVNSDWNATSGVAKILNKPTIPDVSGKADKVSSATSGDVATLNASGNLVDSGKTLGKSVPSDAVFTDTKNTAGSTDSSSKLFLIGATSQAANPQTYSHDTAYVGTDGCLYSGGTKVLTAHQNISGKADKVSGATSGNVATLDANGNLVDSNKTLGKSVPSDAVFTDTNTKVTQTNTTDSADYRLVLSTNANDTTETNTTRKSTNFKANPSTGVLSTPKVKISKSANALITGSGTAGSDKGSGVSPRYYPAKWTFNLGGNPNDGDIITIKIPVAGGTYSEWLSTDNGTTYHPIALNGKSRITSQYAVNTYLTLIYESSGVCTTYALSGADSTADVTGTWRVINYYDSNTTYSNMSQSEADTGTATTGRLMTAKVLSDTISNKISNKADKAIPSASGNVATLDANGNIVDSGLTLGKSVPSDAVFTDTNTKVTQTNTTGSADYRVLLSENANDTTQTVGARKSANLKFNPSTGNLQATQLNGVTIGSSPKFTDTDTKNTAGSTDSSSKLFLIGATSQAANPQTYSHDTAYVGTDGCLYSGGTKVLTSHQSITGKADKVSGATSGNFAGLDANGNLTDSGKKPGDLLTLGTSSSTAYRGDRGNTAYTHATETRLTTATAQGLYKVGSTAQGHISGLTAVAKSDITALGIPAQDTTYESKSASSGGTAVSLCTTGEKYTWNNKQNALSSMSQSEADTGTSTTGRIITAKVLTDSIHKKAHTMYGVTQLSSSANLNSYTVPTYSGEYYYPIHGHSITNMPTGTSGKPFRLVVESLSNKDANLSTGTGDLDYSSANCTLQTLIVSDIASTTSVKTYRRHYLNSTWSSWYSYEDEIASLNSRLVDVSSRIIRITEERIDASLTSYTTEAKISAGIFVIALMIWGGSTNARQASIIKFVCRNFTEGESMLQMGEFKENTSGYLNNVTFSLNSSAYLCITKPTNFPARVSVYRLTWLG